MSINVKNIFRCYYSQFPGLGWKRSNRMWLYISRDCFWWFLGEVCFVNNLLNEMWRQCIISPCNADPRSGAVNSLWTGIQFHYSIQTVTKSADQIFYLWSRDCGSNICNSTRISIDISNSTWNLIVEKLAEKYWWDL